MINARVRPTPVDVDIKAAIASVSATGLAHLLGTNRGDPASDYVMKYMPAQYGGTYPPARRARGPHPGRGFHISTASDFTWGTGCYVCPLLYPFSTAIYGRCGVVARSRPSGWRIFNAADDDNARLYLEWVRWQPLSALLMLTVHANLANQYLRNSFRETFRIDCVAFPPDEVNTYYTSRATDRWLAVSDWQAPARLSRGGMSSRFSDARLVIVLSEEFEKVHGGIGRRTLIGPQAMAKGGFPTPAQILGAYNAYQIETVPA